MESKVPSRVMLVLLLVVPGASMLLADGASAEPKKGPPPKPSASSTSAPKTPKPPGSSSRPREEGNASADAGAPIPVPGLTVDIAGGEQVFTTEGRTKKYKVDAFKIDRTEVTVAAFRKCVDAKKCEAPVEDKDGADENCNYTYKNREDHPVTCVSWEDAKEYCEFVGGRLPTKEEWIFAATQGRDVPYPWGIEAPASGVCWSGAINNNVGLTKTCPVGYANKDVAPSGLRDMAGNVQEWVADDHVYLAGSYVISHPDSMKVTETNRRPGTWGYNFIGFRCAK